MNTYTFADIQPGMKAEFTKEITMEMEDSFRKLSEDENPLHKDDSYAREIGGVNRFKQHVTFGMLTASFLSTLAGIYLPGKYSLIHSIDNISFKKPVFAGDILTVTGKVEDKLEGLNLIVIKVSISNQNRKNVLTARMKVLVQK